MDRRKRIRAGVKSGPTRKSRKIASLDPTSWTGKLKSVPCFILGNAPSLEDINNISILDDYFTIGINRIFFKYDPTILLWQDLALWTQEKDKVLESKALKYCREGSETQGGFYTFTLQGREARLTDNIRKLYGRGSSGSISYQFAHILGCDPIVLVGMDCRYAKDGKTDFYGNNAMHRQHTLPACVKGLKFIQENSQDRTVINCSANKVFSERKTIEEVVSSLGEKKYSREELVKILTG